MFFPPHAHPSSPSPPPTTAYYPIRNGLHSEHPDLKARYRRLLSSRQGHPEEEKEEEEERRGGKTTVVMDGNGDPILDKVEEEEDHERRLGAAVRLERESLLSSLRSSKQQPEHPKGPPAKLCSVTYSMNLTDHDAKVRLPTHPPTHPPTFFLRTVFFPSIHSIHQHIQTAVFSFSTHPPNPPNPQQIDLDPYDQELLGTIMVRLCNCGCAADHPPTFPLSKKQGEGGDEAYQPRPTPDVDSLTLMAEILRGAHIVVDGDKGAFYSWFTQMQDSYMRTSSHTSVVPQFGIDEGSVLRTVLTGRNVDGHTWLQFEGAGWDPFRRPLESFVHACNYLQYKVTGRQVGPLGVSEYTDAKPIRLSFDGCLDERALLFSQFHPDDPVGKGPKPSIASSVGARWVGGVVGGGKRVLRALGGEGEEKHLRTRRG